MNSRFIACVDGLDQTAGKQIVIFIIYLPCDFNNSSSHQIFENSKKRFALSDRCIDKYQETNNNEYNR